jgi:hypothetical protein
MFRIDQKPGSIPFKKIDFFLIESFILTLQTLIFAVRLAKVPKFSCLLLKYFGIRQK